MKYQLIACDLDETLLDSHHGICQKNIDLIHQARALGVKFVPTTGRLFTGVDGVLELLGLDDLEGEYVISANGGIITENKNSQILKMSGLSFEKAKELFEFGKNY
ncbi:MAG: HAD hydrolase family protein, partial [Coprobacillus sp.]